MEAEEKYTKAEFFQKIESGEIKLSVNQISGLKGGTYSRNPDIYSSEGGEWYNSEFTVGNSTELVPTLLINGVEWFHFPKFLRVAGLITQESDFTAFEKLVHYPLKRCYNPFGKGIKRTFVTMEVLEQLGFSSNKKPVIKKSYNLQYNGVIALNINISMIETSLLRIMDKINNIEDRAILCDMHRILKQLQ